MAMFSQLGFEPEGLLKEHVRSQAGEVHDLLVLAHFVEPLWDVDAHDRRRGPRARRRAGLMPGPRPSRLLAAAAALARAGLRPERPDRLPRAMLAMAAYGPTMAGGIAAATARYPLAPARHRRRRADHVRRPVARHRRHRPRACSAAASARAAPSASSPATAGCSCRALVAAAKLGADVVYLNTGFAGPQLADVVAHEGIDTILHDDSFADIVAERRRGRDRSCGSELATLGTRPLAGAVPADAPRRAAR